MQRRNYWEYKEVQAILHLCAPSPSPQWWEAFPLGWTERTGKVTGVKTVQ